MLGSESKPKWNSCKSEFSLKNCWCISMLFKCYACRTPDSSRQKLGIRDPKCLPLCIHNLHPSLSSLLVPQTCFKGLFRLMDIVLGHVHTYRFCMALPQGLQVPAAPAAVSKRNIKPQIPHKWPYKGVAPAKEQWQINSPSIASASLWKTEVKHTVWQLHWHCSTWKATGLFK